MIARWCEASRSLPNWPSPRGSGAFTTTVRSKALCSAGDEHPEHPSPARIAVFDVTDERERTSLRAVVDPLATSKNIPSIRLLT
jgi:hypothetical protein